MLLFQYYNYVSVISIVVILLLILFTILGYKHGFMKKFLSLANSLCGFLFSVLFCSKFSDSVIHRFFGDNFTTIFENNIKESEIYQNAITNGETGSKFLESLGLPSFIANNIPLEFDVNGVVTSVAENMSKIVCVIISFLCLFIGTTILVFVLKLVVGVLRSNIIIRIVDGIFGILLYDILFYIGLCLVFLVISLVVSSNASEAFNQFISNDLQLQNDAFRISKYLYNNNIIGNFLRMFF